MEKEGTSLRNLLGMYSPTYTPDDPSMNVSVFNSGTGTSRLSPYLNLDPNVVQEPEFILPEGASRQRGRFEYAFGSIGGSVLIGAAGGSVAGLYKGIQDTQGQAGKVRRTQILNYVVKRGATAGNALGVMALMYSGLGVLFSWVRDEDDHYNTLAAATATGLLYKSTAGLRKCGVGGAAGFGIAAAYVLWTKGNKDRSLADMVGSSWF